MTVGVRTLLRVAAAAELATLALLLLNLVTVHAPAISGALGPLHGLAYVGVIALVLADEGADAGTRARALVPGIGGGA